MPQPRQTSRSRRRTRAALDRAVQAVVNGLIYVTDGAARPTMGSVPRDLVFSRGKLSLWRVRGREDDEYEIGTEMVRVGVARHRIPVLIVPPLMVRTYVYDLRPEHSMLRTLRDAGFDVYFVDFGVPDRADEGVRLDHYVASYLPACVREAMAASGAPGLSLAGYCMGGIFCLLYAGTFRTVAVRNVVTIGAPVDFDRMGALTVASRLGMPMLDAVLDRLGNVPGKASSLGFKFMSGPRALTKWADLVMNLYDREYVRGFDAINTWVNDLIPYPKEAFRQMVREVVYGNRLQTNSLVFRDEEEGIDRPCDLRAVTCPLLAFAGRSDNIATLGSTRAILDLVASRDKTLLEVPGGHVGVVGGGSAPEKVWRPMARWLAERSSP